MNSFLLSLGIAIVLILVAAFAAPFFIDWSSYRSYFEARASELVGRPVTFAGDLSVRIVPFPSLIADDARIGAEGSGEGIDRIEMRAALTPLLNGELKVTDLVLVRPHAVLRVDPAGRIAWASGEEPAPSLDPDRVIVERFEIVEGGFAVEDERSGETFTLTDVNLDGSATSLRGPFKVEGGGVVDGERYTVRLATGRMADDGNGMRVKASILPAARPVVVDLDGALLRIEGTPAFDGRLVVERPAAEADAAAWRLDGKLVASPEALVLDQMSVRLGTETQNVSLAGAATVRLGADPRFDAVVSARQVDLDRAFGAGPDSPVSPREAIARLGALLDPSVFPLPGHLALDVESTVLSGGLLEGLSADIDVEETAWSIERASVTAPGRTSLGLAGTIGFGGETPAFEGAARLSTSQATVFANWIFGPQARLPGFAIPAGSLEASGQVLIDSGGMTFDRGEVSFGESRIEGSVAWRAPADGGRGVVSLTLNADALDLSERGPAPLGGEMTVAGAVEALLAGVDLELQVGVGSLSLEAITARDLTVSGTVSDGNIRFDELKVGDIGGARLTGAGEIHNYAEAPDGTLHLDASASALGGVVAALRTLGAPGIADMLADRAGELVPAELSADLAAARTETGSRGTLTLAGTAGESRLDGRFGYDGAISDLRAAALDVALNAANPDGARLARQLGLIAPEGAAQAGRVGLTASGRARDALAFALESAGIGIDGTIEGTARLPRPGGVEASAQIGVDIAEAESLLALAGIAMPSAGTALRVDGTLSATDAVWRFPDLAMRRADRTIGGTLTFDMAGAERVVGGRLEADRIDLAWLLGTLVGEEAVRFPEVDYGEPAWPSVALIPAPRPGWRGRIELATPAFALFDGVVVRQAEATFSFDETRLSLDAIRGNLFGGRMSADLDLTETEGLVALAARVDLADARLEEIVWSDGARPVGSGALSAAAELDGSGRSLAAIVSTLSGTGSFSVGDGVLRRLNPSAFDRIVVAADAGLDLTEETVRQAFAGHLDSGSLPFQSIEGTFSVSSGVLRASNIRVDARDVGSFASATVDLPVLGLDSEWTLRTAADQESGRTREVGVIFAGPLAGPSRQIDVNPLLGYLTVRAFEQEVERLEALQSEILERQRLGRELIRLGEDRARRQRESEEAEAAARAAAEAARQAEQAREQAEQPLSPPPQSPPPQSAPPQLPLPQARPAPPQPPAQQPTAQQPPAEPPVASEPPTPDPATSSATGQTVPDPTTTQSTPPAAAPIERQSGGGTSTIDDTDLTRRIEDILRDIPSQRDEPPPTGGVMAREPVETQELAPPPAATPGEQAPPLGAPLVIAPQPPPAVPQGPAPRMAAPQTVPSRTLMEPSLAPSAQQPQSRWKAERTFR